MKRILTLIILLYGFAALPQASSHMGYDITFTVPANNLNATEFYFLAHRGVVNFTSCTYTVEPAGNAKTKIRLQGRYSYVIGPEGFLATICLSEKYKNDNGVEELQNYFIQLKDFDSEHFTDVGNVIKCNLGNIELKSNPTYPFIMAIKTGGGVKLTYDFSENMDSYIEIANWTKMQLKK
ncbi:hypothetical protein FMM05_10055 [Flavobacterium zepuense]|uniref:Uncharacterized protein n=1 Tax=Flavobacterium zepuense TaxID=2593302 RepID=A0A552V2Z4_9FLAO|nr:hypothetical protein [Flavobacterium zepuense]TRW24833.1 hypothetical protein FMM05_10055 [Flavobacterium zepuense]